MTDYKPGDRVKVTNGEEVLIGRFVIRECGWIKVERDDAGGWLNGLREIGSSVEVISPAVSLPTEPGVYVGQRGGIWSLDRAGRWQYVLNREGVTVTPGDLGRTEGDALTYGAPFTRLAPVVEVEQETARKVIDQIRETAATKPFGLLGVNLTVIAERFGVEDAK